MKLAISALKRIFKKLPSVVLAVTALAATSAEASRGCVFTEPEFTSLESKSVCPVTTVSRSLELLGMGEETILFVEDPKALGGVGKTSIVLSSRLEEGVLAGELDEEDAAVIGREIQGLAGARYSLPSTREEILKAVGFPDSVEIADEDWGEMLRVHAERVLSLSAEASEFLLEQLGVESRVVAQEEMAPEAPAPLSDPVVVEAHGNALTTNAGL